MQLKNIIIMMMIERIQWKKICKLTKKSANYNSYRKKNQSCHSKQNKKKKRKTFVFDYRMYNHIVVVQITNEMKKNLIFKF